MKIDNLIQLNEHLEKLDFPAVVITDDFCSLVDNPLEGDYTMNVSDSFSPGTSISSTLHFRRAGCTESYYLDYFISLLTGSPNGNPRKHKFSSSFDIGHR